MRMAFTLLLLSSLPPPLTAQRIAATALPSWRAPPAETSSPGHRAAIGAGAKPSVADPIFGSLVGGLSLAWIGGYLGSRIRGTPCEDCGLAGGITGAAMGFGLGAAAGAHLAYQGQGKLGTAVLVGLAVGAGGALAAIETERWEILLVVPIAQIASAVALHRARRASREAPI